MRDEAEDVRAQLSTANTQLRAQVNHAQLTPPYHLFCFHARIGLSANALTLRAQEEALSKGKTRSEGEAARLQGELEGSEAVVTQFEEKLEQAMGASEKALEHAASWQVRVQIIRHARNNM